MITPKEAYSIADKKRDQVIRDKLVPLKKRVEKLIREASENGAMGVDLSVEDMEIPLYGKIYDWLKGLGYQLQGHRGKVYIMWSR